MGPTRKSPIAANYIFAREIRPKQIIVDHNISSPPVKKIKTEPSIGNGQNGININFSLLLFSEIDFMCN